MSRSLLAEGQNAADPLECPPHRNDEPSAFSKEEPKDREDHPYRDRERRSGTDRKDADEAYDAEEGRETANGAHHSEGSFVSAVLRTTLLLIMSIADCLETYPDNAMRH